MAEAQGMSLNELRDRVKSRLTHTLHDQPGKKLNVLVVGMPGSGKSSYINSMIMAVTGTWHEIARYGRTASTHEMAQRLVGESRVTSCLESFVMFDDNCHEVGESHPMPDYNKNIVFWDCAGFPDATEEVYSTIVSLTLDGRIPSGTNVIECMDQTPDQLRSKFRRVDRQMTFDRIVFVLSADKMVPYNLVEAIRSGAEKGHDVPFIVLVTKVDKCPNPHDLQQRVLGAQAAFNLIGHQGRFKISSLYCEDVTPWPDPDDYRVMKPNAEIDRKLLNIWMNLTDPNIKAKPAPPAPESWCTTS
ncbi:uncharacterized protein LOC118430718 [Branchiostoma floridae]|uniref:Uncharacterized protein LOC118430718 n=1 Tax=Branchiostoma floridae TaxID=7739 RepID=C3XPZ0_BRAFL|nr:uncharacterized protein LOC118430718 [Branchiostoma floridae]|eukprot:XP_002614002.1 hypothetical protein BRAFLDRAFT_67415 [Branchiostoma floridae]